MRLNESKELLVAKKTALKAGELLFKMFREGSNRIQTQKGSNDFATEADYAAQKLIFGEIKNNFPTDELLGEESYDGTIPKTGRLWVIDPLDGTMNFEAGVPIYCVSIALVDSTREKYSPIAGAVYNPVLKEMFYAQKGCGAFLNGKRVIVSEKPLRDGIVNVSLSKKSSNLPSMLSGVKRLHPKTRRFRSLGSTPLQACFVACGRMVADVNFSGTPWDSAAANLIVGEAGGVFCEMNGSKWKLSSKTILAANNNENAKAIIQAFK